MYHSADSYPVNEILYLPTAVVTVYPPYSAPRQARALLDTGSSCSFISLKFRHFFNLNETSTRITLHGLGSQPLGNTLGTIQLKFSSIFHTSPTFTMSMHLTDSISSMIPSSLNSEVMKGLSAEERSTLADPYFNVPAEVDILLGIDFLANYSFNIRSIQLGNLTGLHTPLGSVIFGVIPQTQLARDTQTSFRVGNHLIHSTHSKSISTNKLKTTTTPKTRSKSVRTLDLNPGEILSDVHYNKWKVGQAIGKGSFGNVYSASLLNSKNPNSYQYVAKIEPLENGSLFVEMHFLVRYAKVVDIESWMKTRSLSHLGMPRYISSGPHESQSIKLRFLILDRYGKDLSSVFSQCCGKFRTSTVCRLGVQLLDVLEYVHSKGYVHADVKSTNILLSSNSASCSQIYLVDFGLATPYSHKSELQTDPKRAHDGTLLYTSRDAHQGAFTRRGDIENLAYNLLEWLGNTLPWGQNLSNPTQVHERKVAFFRNLNQFQDSCILPSYLYKFFNHLQSLSPNSEPDYLQLRTFLLEQVKATHRDPLDFRPSKISTDANRPLNQISTTLFTTESIPLETLLKKFWEVEHATPLTHMHPLEKLAEDIFVKTTRRTPDGRYIVSLPFSPDFDLSTSLASTFNMAVASLKSLESRFKRDPIFFNKYKDFIDDYLISGHMSPISNHSLAGIRKEPHYFIPHHGVIKKGDPSASIRVVFNGSAKLKCSNSLNDCLLAGPKLQSDLVKLIMQFRLHKFIIATDIRQMFRQILVSADQRQFQIIVWRDSPQSPFKFFQLNTVTYGLTPSPFLAIRTLQQLVSDEGHNHPLASDIILNNTFVDDLLFGSDDLDDLLAKRQDVINLLAKGKFSLKKWKANTPASLRDLPFENLDTLFDSSLDPSESVKLLGIKWSHLSDSFGYKFTPCAEVNTKRQLLSQIARFYDPVGWLSPLIIRAKVIMQKLCQSSPKWDDPLPDNIRLSWQSYCEELALLDTLSIPRHAMLTGSIKFVLHTFGDASATAYGSAAYLVSFDGLGNSTSSLIISKSRVAPIQTQSIPRLELCAALLTAELSKYSLSVLSILPGEVTSYLWSDSTVVLAWLKRTPSSLNTFVANRVAKIQGQSNLQQWRYIPSRLNPGDLASRGTTPRLLVSSELWWRGPPFITHPEFSWPLHPNSQHSDSDLPDLKPIALLVQPDASLIQDLLRNYSSFEKLINVVAYLLRFTHNCKHYESRRLGPLTLSELRASLIQCVRLVQQLEFSEDLKKISKNLPPSSRLRRLKPFLDENNLLRVGGRLSRADISELAAHPFVLPSRSRLTSLIIQHYHRVYTHAGYQTLHNILAQEFWILSPRRTIKGVIRTCLSCYRTRPTHYQPPMADLPAFRVTQIRPFSKTGLDYAGPFLTRPRKVRDKTRFKTYLCVFVCMVTKAVHLEILTDMTRDCFVACLDRFIARRGVPLEMFSDQGTTFIAANKLLKEGFKSLFSSDQLPLYSKYFASKGILWHFNPPSAPHFGGIWETAVKSSKSLLYRTIGEQCLNEEQLNTLFIRIEAVLNSRPLTQLSSDPTDLSPLTPGHFLVGTSLITLPRPDKAAVGMSLHSRWKILDQIFSTFWKQWHVSYLHTLQQRVKWQYGVPQIEEGDLVLIKAENYPPLTWPLARVIQVTKDSKGVSRMAKVTTAKGTYDRPLVKLCPLPKDSVDTN